MLINETGDAIAIIKRPRLDTLKGLAGKNKQYGTIGYEHMDMIARDL